MIQNGCHAIYTDTTQKNILRTKIARNMLRLLSNSGHPLNALDVQNILTDRKGPVSLHSAGFPIPLVLSLHRLTRLPSWLPQ